jgi:nucleotide-binding universal stress UspA family protein
MLTATELVSRRTAPNLAEPLSRTSGKPELSEIVVFTDNGSDAASMLEFTGLLAEDYVARLIDVFIEPAPAITSPQTFARGALMQEVIETRQSKLESIEGRHRARFDKVVRRHGIPSAEWRSLSHWNTEVAVVHAYYADLVVVARPQHIDEASDTSSLAESLISRSGRPIILFPPNHKASRVRRILVGWNATRESIRAVADALPLLARADTVEILIVDSQHQRERHGQEPGADIARHLLLHGAKVDVQLLSSGGQDVGRVLLSQAAAFGADLLVMGAYSHAKLQEWIFGGITRTVLYEADLPVLMSR